MTTGVRTRNNEIERLTFHGTQSEFFSRTTNHGTIIWKWYFSKFPSHPVVYGLSPCGRYGLIVVDTPTERAVCAQHAFSHASGYLKMTYIINKHPFVKMCICHRQVFSLYHARVLVNVCRNSLKSPPLTVSHNLQTYS